MKLLTKEIEQKLLKSPIGSTSGQGMNAKLIVKFFNPCGVSSRIIDLRKMMFI